MNNVETRLFIHNNLNMFFLKKKKKHLLLLINIINGKIGMLF